MSRRGRRGKEAELTRTGPAQCVLMKLLLLPVSARTSLDAPRLPTTTMSGLLTRFTKSTTASAGVSDTAGRISK